LHSSSQRVRCGLQRRRWAFLVFCSALLASLTVTWSLARSRVLSTTDLLAFGFAINVGNHRLGFPSIGREQVAYTFLVLNVRVFVRSTFLG